MKDLTIDSDYKRGDKGAKVRLIQEWLYGFGVVPDGKFGTATEAAVRAFQKKKRIAANGRVDEATFEALVKPMHSVLKSMKPRRSLGAMIVAYAKSHLRAHPREVGGENMGPWVRLYMGGREGAEFGWCAGFACFVLQQACSTLQLPLPITTSDCRQHSHHPAAARLVQSAADLAHADLALNRVVFFGRCYELTDIHALLDLIVGNGACAELSGGFPRGRC